MTPLYSVNRLSCCVGVRSELRRWTAVFNRLHEEPPIQITPTAMDALPAIADPNVLLTLIGVIGAFIAVIAMMLALRRKDETK